MAQVAADPLAVLVAAEVLAGEAGGAVAAAEAGEDAEEQIAAPVPADDLAPPRCEACGQVFRTKKGLMNHGTHVHGRKRPATQFVATSVCPGCGNDFRTRLRALAHVEQGSEACRVAVLESGLAPLPPDVVEAADAADRAWRHQARIEGRRELAGPPAIIRRGRAPSG